MINPHACIACCHRSPCLGCACSIPVCVCVQVCVQTCAVVYVRAAAVGTTFLCHRDGACARAASMFVRVDRLWNFHTLMIRSIPLCTGFLARVALKDRASTPSIGTDPRAMWQIGAFTWACVHALSALWWISPLADELLVADELFRTSKSKIVADKLFRTSKFIDQEKTLRLQSSVLSAACQCSGRSRLRHTSC